MFILVDEARMMKINGDKMYSMENKIIKTI
jgi:hypothetical protein